MYDKGVQMISPFRETGLSVLPGLQQAANAPLTPFAFDYSAYFASPEYAALQQQQENQALRNASATGGFRSGNAQVALAAINPQLAQQGRQNAMNEYQLNQAAEADRFNRMLGLAGMGADLSSNIAGMGTNFGVNAGNNAMTIGQAKANRYGNQANLFKGFLTDVNSMINPPRGGAI